MPGSLVRHTMIRLRMALPIVAAITLVAVLTALGRLMEPPAAYAHDPHGFYLDCPVPNVYEGRSFDVKLVYLGHPEPGLVLGTYFSTDAGTAGPSDYVEQNDEWTGWMDVNSRAVSDGVYEFSWTIQTRDDDLLEYDETFTVRFGPSNLVVDHSDPARDGECEITITDSEAFTRHADNLHASGVWSNGSTLWVSDWADDKIYAYALSGARLPGQDFNTLGAAGNGDTHGIWSDGTTMYVADWLDPKVYAYSMATKAHDPSKDIPLHADNARPLDIWSDGTTMYVADAEDHKIYGYTLAGERRPGRDISFDSEISAFGIWSDGNIMWVSDGATGAIYAYSMAGARQSGRDIDLHGGNGAPRGMWSDGATMRVLDSNSGYVFEYPLRFAPSFELPSHQSQTSGIWSDGKTTWVSNWGYDTIFAYAADDGARRPDQDFNALGDAGNGDAHGIWSDGGTMWVADWIDPMLYAYDMDTKARNPEMDIPLHADNARPLDIWSDGATMWVADAEDHKIYAYTRRGERRPDGDISFDSSISAFGIWSDGSVMWVADGATGTLYAYNLAGARLPDMDMVLDKANNAPRGIWSDGIAMRVLQHNGPRVFTYRLPLGITLSLDPPAIVEEWGAQRASITVTMMGGRTIPSDTFVRLILSHGTTSGDDLELESPPYLSLRAGSNSGTAAMVFQPNDDDDDEGMELLVITAVITHPVTGETLVSRIYPPFFDNDTVPAAVPDLTAGPVSGEPTKLRVSWGSVSDAEAYLVEWKDGTDPAESYIPQLQAVTVDTSGVISGLLADTAYTVRITAYDTDDGRAVALVSSEASGRTLDAMGEVTASAVADAPDRLLVSWPAVNGATGYRVEWKPAFGDYTAVARDDAAATTETVTGLAANTEYAVRVTALHTIGGEPADGDSAEVTGTTHSDRPVSDSDAAGEMEAWLVSGGVNFGWEGTDTVDGMPVVAYTVQWADGAGGPWATLDYPGDGLYCIPSMDLDYLMRDGQRFNECYFEYALAKDIIVSGTTYYYRVIAHSADTDSLPGPVFQAIANVGGL